MKRSLLMIVAVPLLAQDGIVHITLQQAIGTALKQNPAIAATRAALDEADARIKEAKADYYPQVGFAGIAKVGLAGATTGLGLIGLPNSPVYRNRADSLNINQSISDFGRGSHRVAMERKHRAALEADLEVIEASVRLSTSKAYYALLRSRQIAASAREIVKAQEVTVRQAQAFYEGQLRSRVDLDLSRAALARTQLRQVEAESLIRSVSAELNRIMAVDPGVTYDPELPDLNIGVVEPLPELLVAAFRLRPELQALGAERAAAEENVQLARSQRKPLLGFSFSGGYARFSNILARELTAAGAGLIVPLFTGGRLEGAIEEAEAQLAIVDARSQSLRQQIEYEVQIASIHLQDALQVIPVAKLQEESARSAQRLAAERYKERLGSIVELTASQAASAEALANEATALLNAKTAEADLRFALGRK